MSKYYKKAVYDSKKKSRSVRDSNPRRPVCVIIRPDKHLRKACRKSVIHDKTVYSYIKIYE